MGAENSKGRRHQEAERYGEILVQTDKTTYFGGELVTGKIYLDLKRSYPGTQLYLKLKGKELVHLMIETEDPKTTNVTKEYTNANNEVINMNVLVDTISTFTAGQYEVPFAFMLPKHLPSSFHQEAETFVANISYRLEAYLQPNKPEVEPKLKQKHPFIIRQPIHSTVHSPETEVTADLKDCLCFMCCCCVSKGTSTLQLKFEKNFYAAGETAKVKAYINNTNSKLNVEEVIMALKQKVTLKSGDKSESFTYTKSQMLLEKVKMGKDGNKEFIDLPLHKFEGKDYLDLKAVNMKQYLTNLNDNNSNQNLNPTTYGSLITSEYYLEVICNMEGWWADSPTAMLPLEICHPEKASEVISPPEKWSPLNTLVANLSYGIPMHSKKKKLTVNTSLGDVNINSNMLVPSNLPTAVPSNVSQAIPLSQQIQSHDENILGNDLGHAHGHGHRHEHHHGAHDHHEHHQGGHNNHHEQQQNEEYEIELEQEHEHNHDVLGTLMTDHIPAPLSSYKLSSKQNYDSSKTRI